MLLKYIFITLFGLNFFFCTIASAQNLQINIQTLEDKNSSLDIYEVSTKPFLNQFTSIDSNINFGYTNSSYWFKIDVKNTTDSMLKADLELSQVLLGHIEFYTQNKNSFSKKIDGALHEPNTKYRNYVFKLNLTPKQTQTYYVKVHTSTSEMGFKFSFYLNDELMQKDKNEQMFLSFLFGALFIMLFYNFFIYLSTRDINYLYYCLYLFMIIVHQMAMHGFGRQYVWTHNIYLSSYGGVLIVGLLIASMGLFTKNFLNTKVHNPILNTLINILIVLSLLLGIFFSIPSFHNLEIIINFFALSGSVYLITGLCLFFNKNNRQAKFFILGWFVLSLSLLITYFRILGYLPITTFTTWVISLGILLEMVIFSFALADKLHELKYAKEHQLLLQELNHRVKNNMQIIISMLRLQASKSSTEIKEVILTIQNRIHSMLLIHEQLHEDNYKKQDNSQKYIMQLLNNIMDSYSLNKEFITIHIDNISIHSDKLVNLGFIINELLTNSIKHAKVVDRLDLDINLIQVDKKIILSIKDNGEEIKNLKDGLGTIFVNSIVKNKLNATITRTYHDGFEVKVTL